MVHLVTHGDVAGATATKVEVMHPGVGVPGRVVRFADGQADVP